MFALLGLFAPLAPVEGQTLTARSADIEIGGRVQTQFSRSSVGSATNDIFLRRARLELDITLNEWVDGRLHPDVAGGDLALKDAFLRLTLDPAFRVSFGQFKRSFDLFELASSSQLPMIERDGRVEGLDECAGVGGVCSYSRLTQKLSFSDRDVGVRVEGERGPVSWEASMTNGEGADAADENDSRSFAGRLAAEVAPDWTLGGGVSVHDWVSPGGETDRSPAWSVDLEYGSWEDGLHVMLAAVVGDNWRSLDDDDAPATFRTAQGLLSWYHPLSGSGPVVGVEPMLRISVADATDRIADDTGWVITPGFAAYAGPRTFLSVNLDLYEGASGTESSLKVQTYLYF